MVIFMMEIGKTVKKKEKELKFKFYTNYRWDSLKLFILLLFLRFINAEMEINMMEIGKTIKQKEKELNLNFITILDGIH